MIKNIIIYFQKLLNQSRNYNGRNNYYRKTDRRLIINSFININILYLNIKIIIVLKKALNFITTTFIINKIYIYIKNRKKIKFFK